MSYFIAMYKKLKDHIIKILWWFTLEEVEYSRRKNEDRILKSNDMLRDWQRWCIYQRKDIPGIAIADAKIKKIINELPINYAR